MHLEEDEEGQDEVAQMQNSLSTIGSVGLEGSLSNHSTSYSHTATTLNHEDNVSCGDSATTMSRTNTRHYRRCQDHYQIDLDVARCTWHLLTGDQRAQRYQMEHKRNKAVARIIRRKQRRLGLFINLTLLMHSEGDNNDTHKEARLRYYQGYHDVACIFLTTLASGSTTPGPHPAPPALELPARVLHQVSQSHLSDYLKDNFMDLQTALRLFIFPLLAVLDRPVHDHLYAAEMEPFFCLSWIITWFSHDIRDTALCKRLFDVFLVSHPLFPLYVSIAMVVHPINRRLVLETEPDFAVLHQMLRGLPRNSSMVGWKYRPGDGYVSDDEDDEEDDDEEEAAAVEARLDAAVDGDIRQLKSVLDKEGMRGVPTGATSSVSTGTNTASNFSEANARVPFQELIDLALRFLRAVPPQQLMSLAYRYHGKKQVKVMLEDTNSIALLGELPSWAIRPTLSTETPLQEVHRILRDRKRSRAVVALGFGLSDRERRRRKRMKFWLGVVAVALFAVAVTWSDRGMFQQWQKALGWASTRSAPPSSDTCMSDRPRVGRAVRNSIPLQEATVEADGSVKLNARARTMASGRHPFDQSESGTKFDSPEKSKGPKWLNNPVIRWIKRIRLPRRSLSRGNARPLISAGKSHPQRRRRTVQQLRPLVKFLSTPWEEIVRQGKQIAWDQGRLLKRWLEQPICFSDKCTSGGRKIHV